MDHVSAADHRGRIRRFRAARVAAGVERVGSTKREQASHYILTQAPRRFRLAQIADALPDISQATIRDALEELRSDGVLTVGRGRHAMWERVES